jgi:hypothetical protein
LTHAVHHPLALTSLPPNTLHGPSAAPGLPEYKLQLPHTASPATLILMKQRRPGWEQCLVIVVSSDSFHMPQA